MALLPQQAALRLWSDSQLNYREGVLSLGGQMGVGQQRPLPLVRHCGTEAAPEKWVSSVSARNFAAVSWCF